MSDGKQAQVNYLRSHSSWVTCEDSRSGSLISDPHVMWSSIPMPNIYPKNKLCIIKSAWLTITFFFTWEIKWMTHRMKDQEVKVSCLHFWNVLVTFFEPSSLERNIFLNLTQPMFQINTILEFFVSFSSYTKSDCDPTTKNRFWKFNPTFVLMYFLKKIKP